MHSKLFQICSAAYCAVYISAGKTVESLNNDHKC